MALESFLLDRMIEGNVISSVDPSQFQDLLLNTMILIFGLSTLPKRAEEIVFVLLDGEQLKFEFRLLQEKTEWKLVRMHRDKARKFKTKKALMDYLIDFHIVLLTPSVLLSFICSKILDWKSISRLMILSSESCLDPNTAMSRLIYEYRNYYDCLRQCPMVYVNFLETASMLEGYWMMVDRLESMFDGKYVNPHQRYTREVEFKDKTIFYANLNSE